MSLPADGVNANTLAETTTIPTGKKLIFLDPDTNEGGIITLENLTKQILSNLTSQTFNLDQGNKTLLAALNELNSKPFMMHLPVSVSLQDTIATISIDIADAERGVIIIAGRFGGEIYFSSIINYGSTWDVKQVVFSGSNTIKNEQNKKVLTITSTKAISSKYEVNAVLIK